VIERKGGSSARKEGRKQRKGMKEIKKEGKKERRKEINQSINPYWMKISLVRLSYTW